MTSFTTGRIAEAEAARHLMRLGYKILKQNWKTRYCEIDIVATANSVVYFVEVKYRKTETQGGGLDYITPKKLDQMCFAAEMWVSENGWRGEYRLGAVELSGPHYTVSKFITDWM